MPGFDDLHYEKFAGRKVWIATMASGVIIGEVMPPSEAFISSTVAVWVTETWEGGVVAQKKKMVSTSGILDVFDDNPYWNECPDCGAEPGYHCETTVPARVERVGTIDFHHSRLGRVMAQARCDNATSKTIERAADHARSVMAAPGGYA